MLETAFGQQMRNPLRITRNQCRYMRRHTVYKSFRAENARSINRRKTVGILLTLNECKQIVCRIL